METIEVTSLGAFYTGLAVGFWNAALEKDLELKQTVKNKFLSGNAASVIDGINDLHTLLAKNHMFMRAGSPTTIAHPTPMFIFLSHVINPIVTGDEESYQGRTYEETLGLARRDLTFYFAQMFNAGHLEKLPIPQFSYTNQAKI